MKPITKQKKLEDSEQMKLLLILSLTIITFESFAISDTTHIIKVNFLYGSKPIKKYKTEKKAFGGIHGGHVSIELDNCDYGLNKQGKIHIFSHKKKHHSAYGVCRTEGNPVYPEGLKAVTFVIPLSSEQFEQLNKINQEYSKQTPYDYAFFGMRCAASAQYVLGQVGILEKRNRFSCVVTTFYPKKIRKRLYKIAKEKNYTIHFQEGRSTRKWERY